MKSFADFRKSVASAVKKKEEKKPQKAMDAGARGRRMLQRREYAAKVSAFIPDELKDHYEIDESSLSRIKSKADKGGMPFFLEAVRISLQRKIVQEQNN